jgi:tRNA threonylcarbamoyl adenosine modification protein YeaZ
VVVDSATPAVTAALARVDADGVAVLAERVAVDARAHGELLAPAVSALLAEAGVKPAALAAVVAGLGPGPFTGLRVGLVTAIALAHALDVPGYGVCSLDAIGHGQPDTTLVATDARRREVYWAVYADGVRVYGPAVDRPADAAARAAALGATRAVGDGALRYADVLRAADGQQLPVADRPRYPDAAALARLAAGRVRAHAPGEPLTPLYLRRPDATPPPAAPKTTLQ